MEIPSVDNGSSNIEVYAPKEEDRSWESLEEFRDKGTNNYVIPPKGDYAKIQVEASNDIIQRIQRGSKEAVNAVLSEPGYYNPCALLTVGLYLTQKKDFDQAATLLVGALFRTEIDIRWSQDKTTGGALGILQMRIGEIYEELTEKEKSSLIKQMSVAQEEFEEWDRKTLRKYDTNWILLHGMGAFREATITELDPKEKQAILERFYRELKGKFLPEDAKNASKDDACFFDYSDRKFYYGESGLFLTIPEGVQPILDRFGKYSSDFTLPKGVITVAEGWSLEPKSFEEDYQWALKSAEESEHIERCQINGINAYRKRYVENSEVANSFYLVKGQYSFEFTLYTTKEDEAEGVKSLEAMVNSIEQKETGSFGNFVSNVLGYFPHF